MATFELYRRSTIGMCLTETLDEMVQSGTLSPELAIQVLVQFDKSMTEALESQVKSKVSIKKYADLENLNKYVEMFTLLAYEFYWDICTLTDSATMFGPSSCRMLCSRMRTLRKTWLRFQFAVEKT
ncbi:hypothetical protein TIFTF001_009415 [Ficus carica]|uniref:Transcription initiation factor IIA gamma subunit N-terminal domain-containing protein n=1 Tax=Ficus carica TaxID=3494 RepID=A0AA87ZN20_FICCA|nr:hypothetical protein TIFTF001_009415 [Ficus carica]